MVVLVVVLMVVLSTGSRAGGRTLGSEGCNINRGRVVKGCAAGGRRACI